MSENELVLLEKAQKGDIAAFERLIEAYQKKVYNIALRIVGNSEDASELAQEVFIRLFKSIRSFKGESAFSTWVYRITTNVCLDELRKRKKQKLVYLDEEINGEENELKRQLPDTSALPEEEAERKEIRNIINRAIMELSEEHRLVIVMRDIRGFSYEEIAKALHCPEGTIKSRISRARNALKNILNKNRELFNRDCVK